ncbi:MAG: hypothetical protein JKY48_19490 [Flavobacteriales bacterium]|nr:hypothetical protein [Flavobacteriales bacterium]
MKDTFKIDTTIDLSSIRTLSDLELEELDGEILSREELKALRLFRQLRLSKLKKQQGQESEFNSQFEYFRTLSNFIDYKEFLDKSSVA